MSPVSPAGAPDKQAAVRAMFGRIAGRYDRMNRIMTAGLDGRWRRLAAEAAAVPPGGTVLDLGTGTGDLALDLARWTAAGRVVGVDYTAPMLALAPGKAARRGLAGRAAWAQADAQRLPFADNRFDAVTSAFVLRNLTDLYTAYAEMARVLRPGRRVVALEISPAGRRAWRPLFEAYFQQVVPRLGARVTGDPNAYSYLPESVAAFLDPEALARVMRDAGLVPLPPRRLMFGSLVIHIAFKPG